MSVKRLVTGFDPEFPIDKIDLHPDNPNEGDVGAISEALDAYGFFGALLVREPARKGGRVQLFAGEHRIRAMVAAGETTVPVLFHAKTIDDNDLLRMLLQDNRSARLGRDRPDDLAVVLQQLAESEGGLVGTGFDGDDLDMLLSDLENLEDLTGAGGDGTAYDEDDYVPVTQPGDLWELGPHRVLCGDTSDAAALARLAGTPGPFADAVITDPPYGIDYGDTDAAIELWAATFPNLRGAMKPKSAFYVFGPPGPQFVDLGVALTAAGLAIHGTVMWVKSSFSFSRAEHKYQHEPCFYGWTAKGTHEWYGPNNESSVWNYDKPARSEHHPTQKPVELMERCVRNITKIGDVVFDPFLGSGSTLIAADNMGRACYGIELTPRYTDRAVRRWADHTGQTPMLNGEPFTFTND